jgi:ubiquinone/menaquinone biosynthesis C-methylase UbiE
MSTFKQMFWKAWYPFITRRMGAAPVAFLNYGFWPPAGETLALTPEDEVNRPAIQLYHHVASGGDLAGKNVLEVSCGHGGGASFVKRYHQPKTYIAIDLNAKAIEQNRKTYDGLGIDFRTGDAQHLDFPDDHFDAVISVEASHCYPRQDKFFQSVHRVLRRGGRFLYADFRTEATEPHVPRDLAAAGFKVNSHEEITPHVLRALTRTSARHLELARKITPRILLPYMKMFAGVEGSLVYNRFANREYIYFSYSLLKAD